MNLIKKLLIVFLLCFTINVNAITTEYCSPEAAKQIAKIVYREVGGLLKNAENDAFEKLTTAGVVVNNASGKKGDTFYKKLMNLTNNNYANYSSYKNRSFESVVNQNARSKFLYIARLVLIGEYSLPKQMNLQASKSIVTKYGKVWDYVPTNRLTVYFGHSKKLTMESAFGTTLTSTSNEYYRNLAKELMSKDYSYITVDNVCDVKINNSQIIVENDTPDRNMKDEQIMPFCETPSVLKVFYFLKTIINVIKTLVPVIVIIMGTVSLSKAMLSNDKNAVKIATKSIVTKILIGISIFFIPTLVSSLLIYFGNLQDDLNFTDCFENANKIQIDKFEEIIENS